MFYHILLFQKIYSNRINSKQSNKMYSTSPSWSISGKRKQQKIDLTPSPHGYYPEKSNTLHTPSCKIGKSKRDKENCRFIPGPGHYEPRKLNVTIQLNKINSKYGKFNHQNYHKVIYNDSPGPNCYSPNYKYTRPTTPSSKIPVKQKQYEKFNIPGPGQYQTINKNKNPYGKIGNQKRFLTQKIEGPGPQAYKPIKDNYKKVSVGFTRQQKNINSPQQTELLKFPGPGQYQFRDNFYSNLKQKKGFSISHKYKQNLSNQTPGPGKYNPAYDSLPHSPKISMSGKYKQNKKSDTPGPGQYSFQNKLKQTQHGYSIGKSQRGTVNIYKNYPGPGQYNPKSLVSQTPKYSIRGSRIEEQRVSSPGPGSYNPNKNVVKTRPQSAKIGNSKRCQMQKSQNPGPGQYNIRTRPETASNKFSTQIRDKQRTQLSPGPGDYNIRQIFGHTSSYFRKK